MQNQELREQMLNLVKGWHQIGISQKAYCEQNGIRYYVFHYCHTRFRDSQAAKKDATFVPLQIKSLEPAIASAGIELLFTDGRRILFNQPVSADFLKAVIS